jgi:hypothetical protein
MKKKQFLTEAKRKEIIADKEKVIIESFAKMFNKIKRLDENEIGGIRTNGQNPPLYLHFKVTFADDTHSKVVRRDTLYLDKVYNRFEGPDNSFDSSNRELNLSSNQIIIPVPKGDMGNELEDKYTVRNN